MKKIINLNNGVQIIGKGFVPLFCIDNGNKVVCFDRGSFFLLDSLTLYRDNICKISLDKKRRIASTFPLLIRRYGINEIKCIQIDDSNAFINYHHRFYILNINNLTIEEISKGESNGSVLSLSRTTKGIMFGDYGYNPNKREIGIYLLNSSFQIEQIYRFSKGIINHIHKIVEDPETGRFWILAGDFGNSAGILYSDDNFNSVRKAVTGSQQFRSCNAVPYKNGLIYLTDTPLEENHIIELNGSKVSQIINMNGSCIYSTTEGNNIIYSTTVENQSDEMYNFRNSYKYNLGIGIKDWFVELNSFNIITRLEKKIFRVKKDLLPMIPFQYGCFRFSNGNVGDFLYFYGQAIKKYDQLVMRIRKDLL